MTFLLDLFEFIHHPSHNLTVGVDVRSRNVFGDADDRSDSADISASQTFLFCVGKRLRITDDTAFTAAERNIDNRGLPGHPASKRANRVDGFRGEPTNTALCRTASSVVLNAETLENFRRSIVHLHGQGDPNFTLRSTQEGSRRSVKIKSFSSFSDTSFRDGKGITFRYHNKSPSLECVWGAAYFS